MAGLARLGCIGRATADRSAVHPIAFFTSVYRPVAWSESSRTSSTTRATASSASDPPSRGALRCAGPGTLSSRSPYLTPSPGSRCGCRAGRTSRRSHRAGAFAPGRWTTARRASCRAGRRGVAVDRAQPDGDPSEKQRRRPPPRRPILVGRAMTVTDHASALFFRAVARDRHPTPGCTASRTLRSYEKCFSQHAKNSLTGSRLTASRAVSS